MTLLSRLFRHYYREVRGQENTVLKTTISNDNIIKSNVIGHIKIFIRCHCGFGKNVVFLVITVQKYITIHKSKSKRMELRNI